MGSQATAVAMSDRRIDLWCASVVSYDAESPRQRFLHAVLRDGLNQKVRALLHRLLRIAISEEKKLESAAVGHKPQTDDTRTTPTRGTIPRIGSAHPGTPHLSTQTIAQQPRATRWKRQRCHRVEWGAKESHHSWTPLQLGHGSFGRAQQDLLDVVSTGSI